MKKTIIIFIAVVVVVGGLAFWGGTKYGSSKFIGPENLPQFGNGGLRSGRFTNQSENNIVRGTVVSKSENSVTVEIPNGGSKIVLFSTETQLTKNATGTIGDVIEGNQVMISGKQNSDGSLTASNIQIIK